MADELIFMRRDQRARYLARHETPPGNFARTRRRSVRRSNNVDVTFSSTAAFATPTVEPPHAMTSSAHVASFTLTNQWSNLPTTSNARSVFEVLSGGLATGRYRR